MVRAHVQRRRQTIMGRPFTVRVAQDEEDQDLLDELFLILAFSGSLVVVTLMLYAVVRLLDWSRNKPLPFAGRPLVNIAVVCLAGLLVSALLAGVEFTGPFGGINDSLLRLSESADVVALGLAVFALILVFRLLTVRHER